MLSFKQLSLSRGSKLLFSQGSFELFPKQKIGLVGANGCGKSSLFQLILGELQAPTQEFQKINGLRISHLSQEVPDTAEPALDYVLQGDSQYYQLKERLNHAEKQGIDEEILVCHDLLSQTGGYAKPALAATLMAGLGFKASLQNAPVQSFSGGWRMRLNLARCLMKPADLLLLDEPSNHLDMETIFWLERWLKQSPAALLVISHDREFLDSFSTHILHIADQKLSLYTGNYSQFERIRAEQLSLQASQYQKQQKQITHMMAFVNRFKAKATKAKQAQSRLKAIEKMELIACTQIESPFSFEFFQSESTTNPLMRCDNVHLGYEHDKTILSHINLILNPLDRIALLGPNGEGKSTLIKALTGQLKPLSGQIESNAKIKIGYYAQHQLEELDIQLSPLETIQRLHEKATEQVIRNFLGGFGFQGDAALSSIEHFSGGEKARLALAKLVWQKPNLLLLDEPTNHLDLDMRAAIEMALQSYNGALILISHDRYLLKTTVDNFLLVYQKKVEPFKGDLDDYHEWLMNKESHEVNPMTKKNQDFRDRKMLQNRLKKLEQVIEDSHKKANLVEEKLADERLYEASAQKELQGLIREQKSIHDLISQSEEEWLEIMERLG